MVPITVLQLHGIYRLLPSMMHQVLASIEVTPLTYSEDQPATAITSTITVNDDDNATLTSATVRISANYSNGQDILAFTNMLGISGVFTPATGTLSLTGSATPADYQTALRSVTYNNTNTVSPSVLSRTVTFMVNDGALNSNIATRNISVSTVNDAPVLAAMEGTVLNFNEGGATAIVVTSVDYRIRRR